MERTAVSQISLSTVKPKAGLLLLAGFLWFGSPAATAQENDSVVFRSDVSLARVDAQVLDRNRKPIITLRKEDFVLRERGETKEIAAFSREDVPLDLLILLDVSGSMRPHVERIARATRDALYVLSRKDRVAIMVFDRRSRVSMPFRSNQDEIVRGMEGVLADEDFNGGTDITRAFFEAAQYMRNNARKEARRAIVILTDDRTERNRDVPGVGRALDEANTVVSALITPDAMGNRGGMQIPGGRRGGGGGVNLPGTIWDDIIFGRRMPTGRGRFPGGGVGGGLQSAGTDEIARNSGGDSMDVNDASALEATLEKIRQSYALFFNAPDGPSSGRTLEVSLTADAARRYPGAEVNYRRSYQADSGADPTISSSRNSDPVPPPTGESRRSSGEGRNEDDAAVARTKKRPAVDSAGAARPGPNSTGSNGSGANRQPASEDAEEMTTTKAGEKIEEQPKGGFRRLKPGEKP